MHAEKALLEHGELHIPAFAQPQLLPERLHTRLSIIVKFGPIDNSGGLVTTSGPALSAQGGKRRRVSEGNVDVARRRKLINLFEEHLCTRGPVQIVASLARRVKRIDASRYVRSAKVYYRDRRMRECCQN